MNFMMILLVQIILCANPALRYAIGLFRTAHTTHPQDTKVMPQVTEVVRRDVCVRSSMVGYQHSCVHQRVSELSIIKDKNFDGNVHT